MHAYSGMQTTLVFRKVSPAFKHEKNLQFIEIYINIHKGKNINDAK